MGIRFICETCRNELEVPEFGIGRKAKCPACECVMQIPEPQSEPQSAQGQKIEESPPQTEPQSANVPHFGTTQNRQPAARNPLGLDDRMLATLAHASGLIGMLTVGILGFLGPLVIYLMCQETSKFVANQAKEALNFQISLLLLSVAMILLSLLTCGLGLPLLFAVPAMQIIFGIIASIRVWSGKQYLYPLTIRIIK